MSPYPVDLYGADTKSRTRDLLITNQLLYQLSYVGFGGRIIRILALYGKGEYHLSSEIVGRWPHLASGPFPRRSAR